MSVSQKGAIEKFTSPPLGEGQNRGLDEKMQDLTICNYKRFWGGGELILRQPEFTNNFNALRIL